MSDEFRIERDSMGEMRVPADGVLRRADGARGGELPHFGAALLAALYRRPGPASKRRRRAPTTRSGCSMSVAARRSSRRRSRSPTGRFDGAVRRRRLPDRLRHVDQHERQRGDRQPRHRDLGRQARRQTLVHPNDHVNMGQSTNDVFPTAIHVAALDGVETPSSARDARARRRFERKAAEFADVVKAGRTHLQDAVPMTLGQEFCGYASVVRHGIARVENTRAASRRAGHRRHRGRHRPQRHPDFAAARRHRAARAHRHQMFRRAETRSRRMQNRDAASSSRARCKRRGRPA